MPDTQEWINAGYTPGYGFDCSDFTHWAYSYGLGIHLDSGVTEQAVLTQTPMYLEDGSTVTIAVQTLLNVHDGYTKNYDDLVANLLPGDLLYIRSDPGLENPISHVIMWLGEYAVDTNNIDHHLIMDSHGDVVHDSNGTLIPSGPEIRPFKEDSYYYSSFDHVLRILPATVVPEPGHYAALAALAALGLVAGRRRCRRN